MNAPAMQLDEVAADRKPEPEPTVFACGAAVSLAEPVEYVRQELGRDTPSVIADDDLSM
jgi:hypothetical protein